MDEERIDSSSLSPAAANRIRNIAMVTNASARDGGGGGSSNISIHSNSSVAHSGWEGERADEMPLVLTPEDGGGLSVKSDRDYTGSAVANKHTGTTDLDKGDDLSRREREQDSLSPSKHQHSIHHGYLHPPHRRKSSSSSQQSRPLPADLDIYNHYPYVPKVKLGPRLANVVQENHGSHKGRPANPSTSNTPTSLPAHDEVARAAIPKSVHIPQRKHHQNHQLPPRTTSLAATLEPPQPPPPRTPHTPTTPSSVASYFPSSPTGSTFSTSTVGTESAGIPPEKARLMKALQLRRQQLAMQQEKQQEGAVVSVSEVTSDEKTPTRSEMPGTFRDSVLGNGEQPVEPGTPAESATGSDETDDDKRVTIIAPVQVMQSNGVPKIEVDSEQRKETRHEEDADEAISPTSPAAAEAPIVKPIVNMKEFEKSVMEKKKEEVVEEGSRRPSTSTSIAVTDGTSIDGDAESEKSESTKVRDNVDDSDAESSHSMSMASIASVESRPVTMIRASPTNSFSNSDQDRSQMPPPPVPKIHKSFHRSSSSISSMPSPTTSTPPPIQAPTPEYARPSTSASMRGGLRRTNTFDHSTMPSVPQPEQPVIETARSVSAPFPKSVTAKPAGAVPKVKVGGSVLQRIKQFQQLETVPKKGYIPPSRTPSRSNSPTPEWANRVGMLKTSPPGSAGSDVSTGLRKSSFGAMGVQRANTTAERPGSSAGNVNKPTVTSFEFVENSGRTQLQVTTKIQREPAATRTPVDPPSDRRSVELRSSIDSRRSSIDFSAPPSRTNTIENTEKEPLRPRLFSRSSTNDSLGDRNGSYTNGVRPNRSPSFLKRVGTSLAKMREGAGSPPEEKKVENVQPTTPEPKREPAKREWILQGWINVQLPDTMLWRRRCMKVDTEGTLFLGLSEDEMSPPARRFELRREVGKIEVPDMDEQELPFSVRIVLHNGLGMVQLAGVNGGEQKEVLNGRHTLLFPVYWMLETDDGNSSQESRQHVKNVFFDLIAPYRLPRLVDCTIPC